MSKFKMAAGLKLFVGVLAAGLFFAACNSEDDPNETPTGGAANSSGGSSSSGGSENLGGEPHTTDPTCLTSTGCFQVSDTCVPASNTEFGNVCKGDGKCAYSFDNSTLSAKMVNGKLPALQ